MATAASPCSPRLLSFISRLQRRRFADTPQKFDTRTDVSKHVATEGKKERPKVFGGGFAVPMNTAFPNRKGVVGYEEQDHDLKEVLKDGPSIFVKEMKKLRAELGALEGCVEKKEMVEKMGILKDNEAIKEFTFATPEDMSKWHTGCDADWSEGFSSAKWTLTDKRTAIFSGDISSKTMRDGRVERAGWASVKLEDKASFNRRKYLGHWENFSHLLIKCRGDGRSYKVMLHSPLTLDVTWGDTFSFPLHTHGGPYWQYERIPFSKFFHTVAGRIQDRQYPVNLVDVSSISFVLMDRVDGPFQLELDWIGVVHDRSHLEEHSYETYTLPLFSTHGF